MELIVSTPTSDNSLVTVSDAAFCKPFNEGLIHQAVVAYQAGGRKGTKAQKNRAAVSGGGKKPWRQKGTGRARAGTIRSPIWRSGGVTFAAQPRDHSQKLNKKMYRAALRSIFSELIRQERLVVLQSFVLDSPKTKKLIQKLSEHNLTDVLIVTEDIDENLHLASRNLHKISVVDVQGINPVNLISFEKVVFTLDAIKKVEGLLS